jgi:hypothetical protein
MDQQFFTQLDENNIVTNVKVVQQEFLEANPERYEGVWVETFFDTAGKTYAGIGYEYLPATQNFRPQQPFASWTWVNNIWNAPTPMPNAGRWLWNESKLEWIEV